jgi:hypothetical protein
MRNESRQGLRISLLMSSVFVVSTTLPGFIAAQSQEMKERVAEVKEAVARNKQALAQYTWVERVTISLRVNRRSRSTSRSVSAQTASCKSNPSTRRPRRPNTRAA